MSARRGAPQEAGGSLKVYGMAISYFTGKLEAYLRFKRIPYTVQSPFADKERLEKHVGELQMPLIERDDGRWMTDSTPTIQALESEYPQRSVMPNDPVVRFIALLIEDWADEWLWRSAMHYRWSYEHDRALLGRMIVDEGMTHLRLPRWLKVRLIQYRQRHGWVIHDGVDASTWDHVELGYRRALALMSDLLAERPFLLGASPSIADIGLMGPMHRHFGHDPTPVEIIRNEAPRVFEWLTRTWNAGATVDQVDLLDAVPDAFQPLLEEIAQTHLVQLRENALAHGRGAKEFDMTVQGCTYRGIPTSRYRVWCLEQLRASFGELTAAQQQAVQDLLPHPDAELIWTGAVVADSNYDPDGLAPFNQGIAVYPAARSKGRIR